MSAVRRGDASADLESAAETKRLQPVDSAKMAARPATVGDTYAELEYDALADEQEPLWIAEGELASRPHRAARDDSYVAYKTARRQLKAHREVLRQTRATYLAALQHLSPFRRREPGAKKWYLIRWWVLLCGDVAGQAGAALSYGEHPVTAIPQAFAIGMAALTAGMVGAELRDLRDAARRQRDAGDLPDGLAAWPHLFRAPDLGRRLAYLAIGIGVVAALTIAGGIYWLRNVVEDGEGGAVYGLLAIGIALASLINSYFYADDVADQIAAAESDYTRELRRADELAAHPELKRHTASASESESIEAEHAARGEAAASRLSALKWRVLGNNPGVAGHGTSADHLPAIGRRTRSGDRS